MISGFWQTRVLHLFTVRFVLSLELNGSILEFCAGHFGFRTKPAFLILFFVLGAAAGIRNVMRAAKEINAEIAAKAASKPEEK